MRDEFHSLTFSTRSHLGIRPLCKVQFFIFIEATKKDKLYLQLSIISKHHSFLSINWAITIFLVIIIQSRTMSFIKNFIDRKIRKKPIAEKNQMIVIESDTFGMTVVQQTGTDANTINQISIQEWVDILNSGRLDGIPYNRLYFSFLKGLPNFLRMKIWLLLCTENSSRNYKFSGQMEKKISQQLKEPSSQSISQEQTFQKSDIFKVFTLPLFRKLTTSKPQQKESEQIQKDIKRTYSAKQQYLYTIPLIRKILYALSNSGVQYTQGMNYILLYVIIYCLQSIGLNESTFEALSQENQRNIFIILRQIVLRLDEVFDNQNILKVIAELQQKISETVPDVLYHIYKLGMDSYSLFSQNYYSLLTYSDPPDDLTKQMIDLFFLQGEKSITALIVRMLQLSKDQIVKLKDPEQLQFFVKNNMFHQCFKIFCEQKLRAKTINDFGISFYRKLE